MKQKSAFSQVFLKNKNYQKKVIDSIEAEERIFLEIGSGDGRLSAKLAEKVKFLYCLEIDSRLAKLSRLSLLRQENAKVIQTDFRNFSLFDFKEKLSVFSSVPYYLSSKLIEYLIFYKEKVSRAYLILQKEFAAKLMSQPKEKTYGPISCITQYHAKVNRFFNIPATAFSPCPKVDSTFIAINFYQKPFFKVKNYKYFLKITNLCFRQRRKKVGSVLRQYFSQKQLDLLQEFSLDLNKRPGELSIEDFCKISNHLQT